MKRRSVTDCPTSYTETRRVGETGFYLEPQLLTGLDKLEYSLSAGREGGITDPDYLRKVDAFAEWYRQQPEVTHVQAFSDIMKRLNKNMHGDDPTFYRLPEDPELAAHRRSVVRESRVDLSSQYRQSGYPLRDATRQLY